MTANIRVLKDKQVLARMAAETIVSQMRATVNNNGLSTIALSGGSTPRSIYALLASDAVFRKKMPWAKTHFFWGDERHVAADHAESNYRMAHDAMLSRVPVPPRNVHRIRGEYADAEKTAREYEQELHASFGLTEGRRPQFGCMLLGMGPDGHTASLFPGTTALQERKRLVVSNWVEKLQTFRITMTLPVLNNADLIVFLVSGEEKSAMLRRILEGDDKTDLMPARLIRPTHGRLVWLTDNAAASRLSKTADLT
jgi:6-phosphogluconolactonase